jgi:alanine racemase
MLSYPNAQINLSALKHNFNCVKQHAPKSKIMSVVKADAYGHGMVQVAHALAESDAYAVARLSEGVELRQSGISLPIVILEGVASIDEFQLASQYNLSIVFHHLSQLEVLRNVVLDTPLQFCWLMLETGMNRLGIHEQDLAQSIDSLISSTNIDGPIRLMSHFANSDLVSDHRNKQQLAVFERVQQQYNLEGSLANSAAILSFSASHKEWVRPGIMLYGSSPFSATSAQKLDLKPVMKLVAKVVSIQHLKQDEQVGYGGSWSAGTDSDIAIIGIGYGDGYNRALSNNALVSILGTVFPVIGRVSMDMIAVDISTSALSIDVGDEVTLWGSDDLAVDSIAKSINSIAYEVLCDINKRVVRTYHHG